MAEQRIRRYETIFVVNAALPDEEIQNTIEKFVQFLKEHGAQIHAEVDWGVKKLAYPIRKKWHGHYYVIEFTAPVTLIRELETEYRRDERILRFLTVQLDKYAVEWNRRWRQKLREQKQGKVREYDSGQAVRQSVEASTQG